MAWTVLMADDDALAAASLKIIIEGDRDFEVVAVCHNAEEAVSEALLRRPDLILLDIQMGKRSGLDAAHQIMQTFTEARILMLTTFMDDAYIKRSLELGVKAYLLKQDYPALLPALRSVLGGQTVFGSEVMSKVPAVLKASASGVSVDSEARRLMNTLLSERERDVLAWVAAGKNNKEIAALMYLSEGTVRNLISQILEKLELRDRTQLAIFYLQA